MSLAVASPRVLGIAAIVASLGLALSAEAPGHERTLRGQVEKMGDGEPLL